jgi:hypothetical protein
VSTDELAALPLCYAPDHLLTLAELARRPGWSRSLVSRLLGAHDVEEPNPWYRNAAPLRLYRFSRVAEAERSPEFAAAADRVAKRKDAAARAVETKRRRLVEYVDGLAIEIPWLDRETLTRRACDQYNARQWERAERHQDCERFREATPESDPEFLDRISVNYLRHRCSCYDRELRRMAGKVGADEVYPALRRKVLEAIASTYPALAPEALRQIERDT